MMSVFTKIITGEIPSYKVAENDDFIAFLDINPNAPGHTLCVPKKEVNKIFDLDSETYFDLMDFSREVALALREEVTCERIGMSVIGLEVPHVHVHLIPLRDMEDMRFSNKVSLSKEEMQDIADRVKARFDS
ncbi:HIT family protein [uncultured Nonlabens sp.]|uniref:HIT family protein n=1 Tax=uncultured Nonlabens sp. TaxID=859306 RepID=UPI0026192175|nr:HIT family protein [uncultured Nonlabens sp.]